MSNVTSKAVSAYVAYQFIKLLTTPFEEWKAFEMGLIDSSGKKIRRATSELEKQEFVSWKNIVRKLKMILNQMPANATTQRLASFATALWLLREETNNPEIINNITKAFKINQITETYQIPVIQPGMYLIGEDVVLIENPEHCGWMLNHAIFKTEHQNKTYWFTEQTIQKL